MSAAAVQMCEPALAKVLVADDHHLILDALKQMMEPKFDILAVDNSQAVMDSVERFQPDLVILDVGMPGGDGFSTARKLMQRQPHIPIIFLSMYADSKYVDQAAQLGAKAYLSKRLSAQELIQSIQAVLDGETLLDPGAIAGATNTPGDLTARQCEVLRLIARGCTAKDIANQLNISVRTAEFHRSAIMQRLGMHSTAQMTRYAIERNLD